MTKRELTQTVPHDDAQLVLFKGHAIRQDVHKGEWHFSIVDIMEAIAGTDRPRQYWEDLKTQLVEKEGFSDQLSEKIVQLKMTAKDGKKRFTDTATIETVLRIVQSIPSKQAEPFKRWLARLGYERLKEINDPELAIKRTMFFYAAKGYEEKWITERIKTITSRNTLTSEWKQRGIQGAEYGILSDTISRETFGMRVKDHKDYKGLEKRHNLRDHMSPLELALTTIGEAATTEITRQRNAQGFLPNNEAAHEGGKIAGNARRSIEDATKKPAVTSDNFLHDPNQRKMIP